jgi:hypothetical protein
VTLHAAEASPAGREGAAPVDGEKRGRSGSAQSRRPGHIRGLRIFESARHVSQVIGVGKEMLGPRVESELLPVTSRPWLGAGAVATGRNLAGSFKTALLE